MKDAGKISLGALGGVVISGLSVWGLTEAGLIFPKEFDWAAFSTLVTGAAAVVGASLVGIKQANISAKQTEILDHQVEIERISLRAEMYDRRIIVYSQVRAFAAMVWQDPSREKAEVYRNFFVALESSKFLFGDAVYGIVERIFDEMNNYSTAEALLSIGTHHIGDTMKRHTVSGDKVRRLIKEFEDAAAPFMKIEDVKLP